MLYTYVLGATGCGKTNLLIQLIDRDIITGRSIVVMDMRGDLIDRVLNLHAERIDPGKLALIDLRNPAVS